MKELWDIALAEAIKAKANIAQFWSGENEAQAAYRTNGAVIGLNWDSTGYNLRADGFGYIAPKEGAFAWNQGFALMANAKNVDQAHEFAKWVATPEGSAAWASAFSANPVAKGAHRARQRGGEGLLQLGASGRRDAEAVVVAGAAGLVHQAARRIRRQVQGRVRPDSHGDRRIPCESPAVFC